MSDLKILTQDDVAEWFNSHHHDTVTAVREIDIIRAATGRCYMFSQTACRREISPFLLTAVFIRFGISGYEL